MLVFKKIFGCQIVREFELLLFLIVGESLATLRLEILPGLVIGLEVKAAVGDQCDHQALVKNSNPPEHALRVAGTEIREQVDDMGRKFLLLRHRGLVFDDAGVGNREFANAFVNDLPALVGFTPVDFLGSIQIEAIVVVTLLKLHKQ